jgi:hypothetical protein
MLNTQNNPNPANPELSAPNPFADPVLGVLAGAAMGVLLELVLGFELVETPLVDVVLVWVPCEEDEDEQVRTVAGHMGGVVVGIGLEVPCDIGIRVVLNYPISQSIRS